MRKRKDKVIGLIFTSLLACFSLNIVAEEQISIANSETTLSNEMEYTEWLPNDVYDPNRESSTQYGYVQVTSWGSAALTTKPADGYYKTGTAGGDTLTHSISNFQGPESNAYSSVIDVGKSNFIPVKISTVTFCHTRIGTRTWYASNDKNTWTKLGTSSTSKTGWDIADTGLTISTNTAYRYYRYTVGSTSPGYKGYDSSVYKCTGTSQYNNAGGEQFEALTIEGKSPSYTVYYAPLTWSDAIYDSDTAYTQTSSLKPVSRVLYRYPYYSINYVLDDGTLPDDAVVQYTALASVDLPKPTRNGYTFEGWYDNEEYTGTKYTSITEGAYGDLTLYAKWSANTVALFLMPNNGKSTLPFSTIIVDANSEFPISLTGYSNISKEGYNALGYYGTSTTGGTLYKDDYQFDSFESLVETLGVDVGEEESYVYLYAQWAPNMYILSFDSNGGSDVPPISIACDDIIGKLPVPVKAGYKFVGWFTSASGGSQIVESSKMFSKDTTLYAQWAEKEKALVYIDGVNGNDNNDGLTPSKPVYSLKRAYEIFEKLNTFGTLYVVNTVSIDGAVELNKSYYFGSDGKVSLAEGDEIKIVRYAQPTTINNGYEVSSFTGGAMIKVSETGKLTINDIELNGHSLAVTEGLENEVSEGVVTISVSEQPIIYDYGTLILIDGTITDNSAYGIRIAETDKASFEMHGGTIANNNYGVVTRGSFIMAGGKIGDNNYSGVYTTGNFNMSGGTITNSKEFGVYIVRGTFTMTDGKVADNSGYGVWNGGTFTMDGGTITNNSSLGVSNHNIFNMTGGSIQNHQSSNAVKNSGTFNISGGVIEQTKGANIYNTGIVEMSGGQLLNASHGIYNVYSSETSTVVMTGGQISGSTSYGIMNEGNLEISGGTISGNKNGIYNINGTFVLSNANIDQNDDVGVYNHSNFIMESGTISGNKYLGVNNDKESATFTMNGGEIVNNVSYGILNIGEFNMNSGKITGSASAGIWSSQDFGLYGNVEIISNHVGVMLANSSVILTNSSLSTTTPISVARVNEDSTPVYTLGNVLISSLCVEANTIMHEYNGYELWLGDTGEDVGTVQTSLNSINESKGNSTRLVVDEIYGNATESAVREYQADSGLRVDGITGIKTWGSLRGDYLSVVGCAVPASSIINNFELFKSEEYKGYALRAGDLVSNDIGVEDTDIFISKTYTLTYATSDESVVSPLPASQTLYWNEISTTTVAGLDQQPTTYKFVEWNTSVDGSGSSYQPGDSISIDRDTTLYAQWQSNRYTATFDSNGGSDVTPSTITKTYDETLGNLPTTSKAGHTFIGWFTSKDGGEMITSETKLTGNITYYAHWAPNPYTVNFVLEDFDVLSFNNKTVLYENKVGELPVSTSKGIEILAWYTEVDGNRVQVNEDTIIYGDTTFYADYKIITHKLIFDANGGTVSPETKDIMEGLNYGELPIPMRDGYIFDGWYTEMVGGTQVKGTYIMGSEDTTVYAHWHSANFNLYDITIETGTIASGNSSVNVGALTGVLDGSIHKAEIIDVTADNDHGLIANRVSPEKIIEVLNVQGISNTHKLFNHVNGTFTLNGALMSLQTNGTMQLSSNLLVPTNCFEVYYASDIMTSEFGEPLDFTPNSTEDVMSKNLLILNQYYNYWESVGTRYPRLNDNE